MPVRLPRLALAGIAGALAFVGWHRWQAIPPATTVNDLPLSAAPAERPPFGTATSAARGHSARLLAAQRTAAAVADAEIPAYLARQNPSDLSDPIAEILVARWAAFDAAPAARWVTEQPPSSTRAQLLQIAIPAWAQIAPEQAIAWTQTASTPAERPSLTLALGEELLPRDPLISLLLAEDLTPPFAGELRERSLVAWAQEEPVAAADFAARYLSPEEARRTLTRISRTQKYSAAAPAAPPSARRSEAIDRRNFLAWLETRNPGVAGRVAGRLAPSSP